MELDDERTTLDDADDENEIALEDEDELAVSQRFTWVQEAAALQPVKLISPPSVVVIPCVTAVPPAQHHELDISITREPPPRICLRPHRPTALVNDEES
jgi:hypothetical protein